MQDGRSWTSKDDGSEERRAGCCCLWRLASAGSFLRGTVRAGVLYRCAGARWRRWSPECRQARQGSRGEQGQAHRSSTRWKMGGEDCQKSGQVQRS